MSWDISIVDPKTDETLKAPFKLQLKGGTYTVGGTNELTLNVTYNYSSIRLSIPDGKYENYTFGDVIRRLNGMKVDDYFSFELLEYAYLALTTYNKSLAPASENYWEACPGNARRAIADLIELAQFADEDSIWRVE